MNKSQIWWKTIMTVWKFESYIEGDGIWSKRKSIYVHTTKSWLKLHLAYFSNFFLWMRVLKHSQYVEIKQFFKVGIKQNNVSTVIWLIKFLVDIWSGSAPPGESRVVYIFVYITRSVFSDMCISIIMMLFILIISDVHKDLSSLRRKNWNRKYKSRKSLFIS